MSELLLAVQALTKVAPASNAPPRTRRRAVLDMRPNLREAHPSHTPGFTFRPIVTDRPPGGGSRHPRPTSVRSASYPMIIRRTVVRCVPKRS